MPMLATLVNNCLIAGHDLEGHCKCRQQTTPSNMQRKGGVSASCLHILRD